MNEEVRGMSKESMIRICSRAELFDKFSLEYDVL